ncbi:hypothetical protein MHYP_G00109150 [Metynnis hypsauchen]
MFRNNRSPDNCRFRNEQACCETRTTTPFSQTAHPKVMSGHSEQKADEQGTPDSLGLSGAETDRYGFLLGNGDAQSHSDEPCPQLVRHREMKWLGLMNQWDQVLEKKNSKIKGQCQKGIPASVRAKCWPLLCGATHRKEKNQELYKTLDSAPGQQSWIDVIKRDTDRQFPFHEMFLNKDSHGQQGLLRVLKAYTQFRPEEGYCQAQGPVAAVLLMNMPMEEAFWCLVQISELYLPGYYSPLLEGVLFDAAVLSSVLKRTCPAAYKHLQRQGVEPLMFATDWLMCLYSRHLPFNTLLRVWDLFFCYGVRVLFQVAVVLVRRCLGEARQRKECEGQMETLERLRGVRGRVQHEPADAFIQEVCSVPLSLGELQRQTEKELVKWRKERPDSTFDPRDRCHGYHMVWEKWKEKENVKKERQSGNLTVPLTRSHSSLSPAILRKKWRKRGSKADTEEWEGGGRRFSQGVKEESSDGEERRSVCSAAGEFRLKTDSMTCETGTRFKKDCNNVIQHEHLDTWSSSELSDHSAPVFEEEDNDPPDNVTQMDCDGHDRPTAAEKDLQAGKIQEETETQTATPQSQDSVQTQQDKEKEETQTDKQDKETLSHQEGNDDETQQMEEPQTSQQEEETHVTTNQHKEETQGNISDQEDRVEVNISEQEGALQVNSPQAAEMEENRNILEEETDISRSKQEKEIGLNVQLQVSCTQQAAEIEGNGNFEEEETELNRCRQDQEIRININEQQEEIQKDASEQETETEVTELFSSGQEVLKSNEQEKERQINSSEQELDVNTTSKQEDSQATGSNEEEKNAKCLIHELDAPEEKPRKQDAEEANKEQQVLEMQTSEEQDTLSFQTQEKDIQKEKMGLESKKEEEEIRHEQVAESDLSKETEKDRQITDKPGESEEPSEEAVIGEEEIVDGNSNHQSADEETLQTVEMDHSGTSMSSQVVECPSQADNLSKVEDGHTVDEDTSQTVSASPSTFIHVQQETELECSGTPESSQVVEPSPQVENLEVKTVPEVQTGIPEHCEVSTTGGNPEPQQPADIKVAGDMEIQNDPVSGQSQSANLPKPASSNPHSLLRLRRSSSSHTSYPTILSEDTFRDPHQSDEQEHNTHTEATKADNGMSTKDLTQQAQTPEAAAAKAPQSKTHTPQEGKPKRRGLFHRFRGETTPKSPVPKILIQDFSEGEEKLSSKERRRRRREKERKEKEEEKERKKREKELEKEKEKEKERKKPQTRGKSFQVLSKKSDDSDAGQGSSGSQTLRSKRNSAPHSESYF